MTKKDEVKDGVVILRVPRSVIKKIDKYRDDFYKKTALEMTRSAFVLMAINKLLTSKE